MMEEAYDNLVKELKPVMKECSTTPVAIKGKEKRELSPNKVVDI